MRYRDETAAQTLDVAVCLRQNLVAYALFITNDCREGSRSIEVAGRLLCLGTEVFLSLPVKWTRPLYMKFRRVRPFGIHSIFILRS